MSETSRHEQVLGPLKVGLRRDLHLTRQETRGGPRYVVHDPVTFQNHAFGTADYEILTSIVRTRSLADTLGILIDRGLLEDTDEDRVGFYRFVLWLHGIGLLHLPLANGDLMFERHQRRQAMKRSRWYTAFLNHRIPLGNPDPLLRRTLPWFGWLFSSRGLLLWLVLMGLVGWKCFGRFDELFAQTRTILAFANLPLLWLTLVALKAIHEFGHAYACRRFGAKVPEMGIVMIMMTPCAYVDASASWRLTRRRHRAVVALGGMYVESFVAGIAALVWAGTAPGLAHDLAFNVVALASVVTVLFNVNPLMRYDGYYLFSDLVGVFNLQQRATAFLNGWASHLVLGTPRPRDRWSTSERWIYGLYGPCTFVYRILLSIGISALVMMQWPGAGLFLAVVFLWALVVEPVWRTLRRLWNLDARATRARARLVAIGAATLLPLTASVLPVSWSVTAPGIIDPRTRESVRAPNAGFVKALNVENGAAVGPGDVLCLLQNPELETRQALMQGELDTERISLDAVELEDATQAAVHRARIAYLSAGVAEISRRLESMELRSSIGGTVSSSHRLDFEGRFLQQGEELFQVQSDHRFLRVVLTDEDFARTRLEVGTKAEVRFVCNPSHSIEAVVHEIRAAASRETVPLALTMLGGGEVYATPAGETGGAAVADRPYLHVLLEIDSMPVEARGAGLTARVRLPARVELLGTWLHRKVLHFLNAWWMT